MSTHDSTDHALTRMASPVPARYGTAPPTSFAGGMEMEARTYLDILRRNSRLIRTVFLAVLAATLAFTFLRPPVYRSGALIEIRRGVGDVPTVDALFASGDPTESHLRTHVELLRSATLARRVIEELNLHQTDEFADAEGATPEEVIGAFQDRLVVDPIAESRLVRVSFEAGSAELAARVANTTVDVYRRLQIEGREEAARRLTTQLESARERLEEAESRLAEYAEVNDLPYLVEEDLTARIGNRLTSLEDRLVAAETERFERESLMDVVVQGGRADAPGDAVLRDLEAQLAGLRSEYARLSATFTDAYPATAEVKRQIEQIEQLIAEERARVGQRIERDYRLALQREQMIEEAIQEQQELASRLGPQAGTHHLLRQSVLANRELYTALQKRQREAETAAAIGAADFTVADPAIPPSEPHRPAFAVNVGLGTMLGLVLGVGAAFLREVTRDSINTPEDVPAARDLPVLAMIPALDSAGGPRAGSFPRSDGKLLPWASVNAADAGGGQHRWPRIDNETRRSDPAATALADAFGTLRTAVLFRANGDPSTSILVTSCRAGEGKTTVSVNLAISLARLGRRVLLIDADLRRPAVHRALGVDAKPGLIRCLARGRDWRELVRPAPVPGLEVLPCGGTSSRAGDLLAGNRLPPLLREAREEYDFVIVDAPALFINAADARILSQHVDGVVTVVRSRSTPRPLVARVPEMLPNLIGIVVNDLRKNSLPDYFGDYFADYGVVDCSVREDRHPGTETRQPERHSGRAAAFGARMPREQESTS